MTARELYEKIKELIADLESQDCDNGNSDVYFYTSDKSMKVITCVESMGRSIVLS